MQNLITKITFLLLLLVSNFISAEELSFYIDQNFAACNTAKYNQLNVKTNYAEFKYDTVTKELNIEVEFTNQGGTSLANGFHFGINSEDYLIRNRYKLAYFYVDGRVLKSGNQPTITAYIYNREEQPNSSCNNAPGSWQTNPGTGLNRTEPILLSGTPNTNPSWVSFAEMSDTNTGGILTRKFSIIIDTTAIQAFIPNNTNEYQQEMAVACKPNNCLNYNNLTRIFDFGRSVSGEKRITLDFLPSVISNSTYNTANELTNFNLSSCSLCRVEKKIANTAPSCTGITGLADKLAVGEPIQANINFYDPNLTDQHRVQFLSSLKPSMQFVTTSASNNSITAPIANNGVIPTGHKQSVKLNWTPSAEDIGSYSIPVRFQQTYGQNGSLTSIADCTLNFEVIQAINSPVCETTDLTTNLGTIQDQLSKLRTFLLSKNKSNQKFLSSANKKRRQDVSTKINSYTSLIQSYLTIVPLKFVNCSSGYNSCQVLSVENELYLSRKNIPVLYCDGKKILGCSFIENIGFKLLKSWKRNQTVANREAGTLTPQKLALITLQYKKANKKASNLSFNAYNGVEGIISAGLIKHYTCE